MSKDPAFLFYPGDWLGGTMGMTFEQKGCYLELLMMQFNHGKFTELQAKQVLSICFDNAWPMLKNKFIQENGYYYNERLQEEVNKRKNYIESRRYAGLTPKKKKAYAKHTHKHSENEDEDEDIVKSKKGDYKGEKEMFDIFRKNYPGTKRGNETEFDNFIKKHKDWKQILPLLINRLNYQIEAKELQLQNTKWTARWKHLSTWINQRGWEIHINTEE